MPVTRKLQTKDSDIAQSIDLINTCKLTIKKLKNNSIFITRIKWDGIAAGLPSKLDFMEPKVVRVTPRICSKQIYYEIY